MSFIQLSKSENVTTNVLFHFLIYKKLIVSLWDYHLWLFIYSYSVNILIRSSADIGHIERQQKDMRRRWKSQQMENFIQVEAVPDWQLNQRLRPISHKHIEQFPQP